MAGKIRSPAVAGLFYPAQREELLATVDGLLAEARHFGLKDIRALIVPHAGYSYSGIVAAAAYAQIRGCLFRRVIILGPSHHAYFRGVAVVMEGGSSTPLGVVNIDDSAPALAACSPFFGEKPVPVEVPGWALPGNSPALPLGLPHTWEHAIEVQLPFLQRVLTDFGIVPALFGDVRPEEAAQALLPFVDEATLILVSSDLSHYRPHEEAVNEDQKTLAAISSLDLSAAERIDACGRLPIATVIRLAKTLGWSARILDYRTSGDTSGDYSAVVGYAAVAFWGPCKPAFEGSATGASVVLSTTAGGIPDEHGDKDPKVAESPAALGQPPSGFTREERRFLLQLARDAVRAAVQLGPLPSPSLEEVPERLRRPAACFVTLKSGGQLRGCIGTLSPKEPLYLAVVRRAQNAAVADPRFPPVREEELPRLHIEISVLREPRAVVGSTPAEILTHIEPGRHGVVLRVGAQHATFLPQVWEHFPDKQQFMERLAVKAGLPPQAWAWPGAEISVYEVGVVTDDEDFSAESQPRQCSE